MGLDTGPKNYKKHGTQPTFPLEPSQAQTSFGSLMTVYGSGCTHMLQLRIKGKMIILNARSMLRRALSRNQVKLGFLLAINCFIPDIIANVVAYSGQI